MVDKLLLLNYNYYHYHQNIKICTSYVTYLCIEVYYMQFGYALVRYLITDERPCKVFPCICHTASSRRIQCNN